MLEGREALVTTELLAPAAAVTAGVVMVRKCEKNSVVLISRVVVFSTRTLDGEQLLIYMVTLPATMDNGHISQAVYILCK